MRDYLIHMVGIYLTVSQVYSQDCPWGWMSQRNNAAWPCYLFTNKIQRSWPDAQRFCEQMGGGLLKIDTMDEKTWVFNVLKQYQALYHTHKEWWIGLHDNPAQTGEMWLDRSVLDPQLLQWVPGEPAHYDHTSACVEYYNGSLRHQDCTSTQYFICERARQSVIYCDARNKWESINGKCYKVVTRLRTWDDARGDCQAEQADLLVVTDISTQIVLYNFIESRQTDMWIGLRAYQSNGGTTYFKWLGQSGTALVDLNSYWTTHLTQSAIQSVVSSNRTEACVIANHTFTPPYDWQTADCSIRSFAVCQKNEGSCASGWIPNGNNCYSMQTRAQLTWPQANAFCNQLGANLLYINDPATQMFINNNLVSLHSRGIDSIWLGLSGNVCSNDNNTDGDQWMWSNGQPLSLSVYAYNNLNSQTPVNRPGVLDCFTIFTDDTNGTWQAATDCMANKTFMCSIPFNVAPKVPTLAPPVSGSTLPTTSGPTVVWASDCGPFWIKDNATGYCYQLSDNAVTWFEAESRCENMGAQLASINSYHDQRFIADRLFGYKSSGLWIGTNDLNSNRGFHWIDGSGFGYLNWAPGEPNNMHNNEACGELVTRGTRQSQWNDNDCNAQRGYICKKKSSDFPTVPPPTTPVIPAGKVYSCPDMAWVGYKNTCFLVVKMRTTWNDANQYCKNHSTELASIADENEFNYVLSQLIAVTGYRDPYWIGLNDMEIQMTFKWSDSTPVLFTNWAEHEPNNWQNRREDCVTMYQTTGQWNDDKCDEPQTGFICKMPKAILPTSAVQPPLGQGCPAGFLPYGYKCYHIIPASATWTAAQSNCYGGTLANIHDRYQQAFLASQIAGTTGSYWIGLRSSANGNLTWTFNGNVDFTAWSKNHTGNENNTCVAMGTTSPGVGLWQNSDCSSKMNYICETPRSSYTTPQGTARMTSAPLVCPSTWHEYTGYCYKGYSSGVDRKSWFDARDACRGMGADLVSLHNSAEQRFAFSNQVTTSRIPMMTPASSFWIGLNDFDVEMGFRWSDGTALSYTNWGRGEPNDGSGNDDCVEYNTHSTNWNDNNCYLARAYVCKIQKGNTLLTPISTPAPTQPAACGSLAGWKLYNGTCYLISSHYGTNSRLSWYDARDFCLKNGADLASVHSEQENGFIVTVVSLTVQGDVWLGLTDVGVDQFGWTDGTPLDYVKWSGNEPNDKFGREKCGQIGIYNGYWNDNDCNDLNHFVCKRSQGTVNPVTVPPTTQIPGGCPAGFTAVTGGNKCYKLVGARSTFDRKNYASARDACRGKGSGSDIASIGSHQEQATLLSMINGQLTDDSGIWIGLSDQNNNRRYTWQDSSRLQFTNWDKGEPQQSGGQCVEMYSDNRHAGKWNNIQCLASRPYICQTSRSAAIPLTTPPPSMCTMPGYIEYNFDCYKVQMPSMQWLDAKKTCELDGLGYHLTSILNVFEQSYIDTLTSYLKSPVWIGLADPEMTGTYRWEDGFSVQYSSWDVGEPTFTTGEGCIVTSNGLWNDTICNLRYPSVCKKSFFMPPSPTGFPSGYCSDITWRQFGDYCYYISLQTRKSWADAAADCQGRGMNIASITVRGEEDFILQEVDRNKAASFNVWIGFRKEGGFFTWSDGSDTSYINWDGSPSMSVGHDCVMLQYANGKWKDSICTSFNGYVCKAAKLAATSPPPTTTTQSTTTVTTTASTTLSTVTSTPQSSPSSKPAKTSKQSQGPTHAPVTVTTPGVQSSSYANIPIPQTRQQKQVLAADLSTGQISGVVVGSVVVLVAVCGILMLLKHRSGGQMFSFRRMKEGTPGFDNATYDTTMDSVQINGNGVTDRNLLSSNSNGFRMGFTDIGEEDA